jgi:hypothetical protein
MLKRASLTLATVCSLIALPHAQATWEYVHKPFAGKYTLYGGFLDEAHSPTPGDTKLVVNLTGNSAKEMFNGIGPDGQTTCADGDARLRQRDMLLCRYHPKDGYWCTFGFDLSTGLSIGGAVGGAACQAPR